MADEIDREALLEILSDPEFERELRLRKLKKNYTPLSNPKYFKDPDPT